MVGAGHLLVLVFALLAATPQFPPLIWDDDDRKTIPEPQTREIAMVHDFFVAAFGEPVIQTFDMPRNFRKLAGIPKEAENINGVDEVPNSSWYTNRNFLFPMSVEEIARGPEGRSGPSMTGPWTIVGCKTEGISPGLEIRDQSGDRYLIKFDPADSPEMASAAEVVGSVIFHAAGYNVPANTIVTFPRTLLAFPTNLPCSPAELFSKITPNRDGTFRAVASKYLPGKPKGPFSYSGWRKDDPNDVIAHEHRRELRGLRVIAAFINHNDLKQLNTLDMYVEDRGRRYLKHYFIDFGASLGSATIFPKQGIEGHEYIFDLGQVLKSAFTLGLSRRKAHAPEKPVHPAVGHIEGDSFNPAEWKPNLPIPSLENMTRRDGYWGAKIVAAFTDQQLRAAVKTGRYSDPAAEDHLVEILRQRRNRIADHWFRRVAPLDRFRISRNALYFDDLAVVGGYDDASHVRYRAETESTFQMLKFGDAIAVKTSSQPSRVRITRASPGWPDLTVEVYVQNNTVIGILR
jgi:hypothetical protein